MTVMTKSGDFNLGEIRQHVRVAYFSMEIGLDHRIPTYSGGLGVLAGDSLRAAADLGMPMCAVSLIYHHGYFRQQLDANGAQSESPVEWNPKEHLQLLDPKVAITIEGRTVHIQGWMYKTVGARGHVVPVFFLDTNLPENAPQDRTLCEHLYGGDEHYRLCQEVILGMGGVRYLEALGLRPADQVSKNIYDDQGQKGLHVYHMNEGHAALLTIALLEGHQKSPAGKASTSSEDSLQWVKERCVFTTHTPVPAGHDTFPVSLVNKVLGKEVADTLQGWEVCPQQRLNMSHLAIRFSKYINGVAKRHGEVSQKMFSDVPIAAITNGIHVESWTADSMRQLFDKHLSGWREDNSYLRYACEIPLDELTTARQAAKKALFDVIATRTGKSLDLQVLTLGFARRAAEYKRADLLFQDVEKLSQAIGNRKLQIVFAGKAHPKDFGGKDLIKKVFEGAKALVNKSIEVVYLENYDMELGRLICSGVDVWLNNPVKPLEASGTSGMKAAANGIPSFSTLDGWWVEGCINDVTGWEIKDDAYAFGAAKDQGEHRQATAEELYRTLGENILPAYYDRPQWWAQLMRQCIFLNGPYFSTHRMMLQYANLAYGS